MTARQHVLKKILVSMVYPQFSLTRLFLVGAVGHLSPTLGGDAARLGEGS